MSSACKVVAQLSTSAQAGSRARHMGSTVAAAATAANRKLNSSSVSPWFFDAAHQEQWKSESLSKKAMAMQAVEKAVEARVEAQSVSGWRNPLKTLSAVEAQSLKTALLSKRAVAMQAVEKAIDAQSVSSVNPLNFSSVSPWFFDAAHQEQWKSELLSKKATAMQAVEEAIEAQFVSDLRKAVEAQFVSKKAMAMQAVEKAIEAQSVSTVNPLNFSSVSPWYFDAAHQEQWKAQMLRKKAAAMQDVEQAIEAQFVTPLALDFDASHQEQAQSELFRSVAMQPFSTSFGASPAYSQQSSEAASAALAELLHICVYNSETPSQTVSRRTIHSHGGVKGRLAVDSTKSHEPESQDVQEPEMAIRL